MYESFYGLREKPFTLLPDPDYLYLSPKHQRALTLLEYGMMNQAGFSVICGDTGAGKTTLIRRLLTELGDDTKVGLITNTHQSFGELLNWVLMAFGLDGEDKSKAQMHQMFIEFLIEQYAQNKHTVLIVDEAQNMSADTLEELRMLSNINADKDQVLQVILAGQPALRETLRQPELMQFAQRIAVDYYLEALSEEETEAYIHHRLKVAGAKKVIFTDAACSAIYKYSGGTPRLINLLCDTALVYGFAEQTLQIDAQLVHDVVREQHSNSIIPTFNTSQPHSTDKLSPVQKPEGSSEMMQGEKPVIKKPVVEEAVVKEEKQDAVAAMVQQQAVNMLNNASARQQAAVHTSAVSSSANSGKENRSAAVNVAKEVREDSKITPINTVQEEKKPAVTENTQHKDMSDESKKDTDARVEITQSEPVSDAAAESGDAIANSRQNEAESVTGISHQQHFDVEAYPIVHVEENPKKGINMMLLGLVGGMFFASVIMMAAAWMLFNKNENNNVQLAPKNVDQQEYQREAELRQMEAIQKERDAALAEARALERERDAAIKAAQAQEKIREAEKRATEILAEQERRAERRLRQARERARKAEQAELLARKRERELQLKNETREAELEAQRLKTLQLERQRLELLARKNAEALRLQQAEKEIKAKQPAAANTKPAVKAAEEKKDEGRESFSTNPCNSPSAKFLSTCKK